MKLLAYLLMLYGVFSIVCTVGQKVYGHPIIRIPLIYGVTAPSTASWDKEPTEFKREVTFGWVEGSLVLLAGLILLSMLRRQDRLDPMSPSFQGKREIDKLNDSRRA